jgi:hypothetical protein
MMRGLAMLLALIWAMPVWAQINYSLGAGPNFGRIATGAATTSITVQPDGTRVVGSGGAAAIAAGGSAMTVTISCIGLNGGQQTRCNNNNLVVRVALAGAGTSGRLQVTQYNVGQASRSISGGTPAPASPLLFTFAPIGNNQSVTFSIGAIANFLATGTTGNLTVSTRVTATVANSGVPPTTGGATANVQAFVARGISAARTSDLVFGRVVSPSGASGTISIAPGGTVSGTLFRMPGGAARSAAAFTVSGEGGQAISVSIPASVYLSDGANTLSVATSNNLVGLPGDQFLSGAVNSAGTLNFNVGGTVTVPSATPAGTYSGTLTVTVSYH